ncbi:hypothetical protein D3C86_1356950 [compost metagenome]
MHVRHCVGREDWNLLWKGFGSLIWYVGELRIHISMLTCRKKKHDEIIWQLRYLRKVEMNIFRYHCRKSISVKNYMSKILVGINNIKLNYVKRCKSNDT